VNHDVDITGVPAKLAGTPVSVLEVRNVSKTFGSRRVLKNVSVSVRAGEVHGLVGPNGSGKSTLIKILAGYHQPDDGSEARYCGRQYALGAVPSSQGADLRFVHQDLALALEMNAVDNIAVAGGYSRGRLGVIDWAQQRRRTEQALGLFGIDLDVSVPLYRLAPVERSAVAIVRALAGWDSNEGLLVLDEPTASLPADEVQRLHDLVHRVAKRGAGVVYVSHRLDDVVAVSDRVSVLRDGDHVGTVDGAELSVEHLASLMVGRRLAALRQPPRCTPGKGPVLEVRGLSGRRVRDVSFDVSPGEIVGVAGVLGSGREELPYLLAGVGTRPSAGSIQVGGRELAHHSPLAAQSLGLAFVPADRKREAVIHELSVGQNLSLSVLDRLARFGRINLTRERRHTNRWIDSTGVVPPDPDAPMRTLSGGNQQKVVFARALALVPSVLVLAEPTAGVDIGAREALYDLLRREAESRGLAVVVCSSDEGDLVSLCNRVLVLADGSVAVELDGARVTEEEILTAAERVVRANQSVLEEDR
jgi:ABC-type sugar transport system ATPase subunit